MTLIFDLTKLYQLPLFLLILVYHVVGECEFPEFLQRENPWTATYANDGQLILYFKTNLIEANLCPSSDKRCVKFDRKCLKEIEIGKYLVEHRERTRTDRLPDYLCMQFITRSEHIVQLRTSHTLPHQSPSLCREENLNLDKWPIISPSMMKSPPITCPFSGGYNMRIRGPEGELCSRQVILPRMESECEGGDGIHFDFRYKDCIHRNLEMKLKQKVDCVAEWSEGPYTFVILRPDRADQGFKAWCMRLTQPLDNLEKAYLFMDFVCDPGDGNGHGQIKETSNYLSLSFDRITIPSVCANEFEGCTNTRFCDTEMRNFCHRSCDRCRPEVDLCPFPEDIQGEWILDGKDTRSIVTVKQWELTWPEIGKFKCLPINDAKYKNKTVLLHTFDNGCFPRFACMESFKPSTSTRQFRLGNRVNWPVFPLKDAEKQACQSSRFRIYIPDEESTKRVHMPRTTVIHTREHFSQSCHLPAEFGFQNRPLYFREGNKCDGCISHDSAFHDRITVRPLNCSVPSRRIEYICLASFKFDNITQAVITGKQENNRLVEFLCWIFTGTGNARKIIVLNPADCNTLSFEMVLDENMTPKAQFQILDPPPKICPSIIIRNTTPPGPDPGYSTPNIIHPSQDMTSYRDGQNIPTKKDELTDSGVKDDNKACANSLSISAFVVILNLTMYILNLR